MAQKMELDEDCEQEWDDAMETCQQYLTSPSPPLGVTGRCTSVYDCARGLVAARCGGNALSL
jgi:hypothetical protein